MRWRIFAPLLPTAAAACSLAAAAVKSVQLAEEEKICSCQLRFMSGPDHCDCYVPIAVTALLLLAALADDGVVVVAHMHTAVDTSEVNVS